MTSETDARARILREITPLPSRCVPLASALDHFAPKDVIARVAVPNFDNSSMDGYAVIAAASRKGNRLHVVGEQPAGKDRHLQVKMGETVRIFTGAPIPNGADAVVMQEDVTRDGDEIVLNTDVDPGEFIRQRGGDLSEGQIILRKGERIRITTLALLASQGLEKIEIGGQASASIISTGDELAAAGKPLQLGEIYDSNATLLSALVAKSGASIGSVKHCNDELNEVEAAIQDGARRDVMIITGGVSVGARDLVQEALRNAGAKIDIWRVAIKPGKPFLFARLRDCFVFGLPGNAVSAFVTFLCFVRPAILQLMGAAESELALRKIPAQLDVDLTNDGDRAHYFRGKLEDGKFKTFGRQESHALFGLSQSNALLRLEEGGKISAGSTVKVEIWD